MTIHATLEIIKRDGSHELIYLKDADYVEETTGGFEVRFASSPGTVTFFPYHRIWEYQEIDTDKSKKITHHDEDNHDPSMD